MNSPSILQGIHGQRPAKNRMNWFFEQFPMEVPFRTREEVLDIIEGKKSLNVKPRSGR